MTNIATERSTIFKNGKPSISMGHGFHGYVSHNQRVPFISQLYYAIKKIKKNITIWLGEWPSSYTSYDLG